VIGGHAVAFHGHIRATEDVDIIWLRNHESEGVLLAALQEAHAQWISDDVDPATRLEKLVPVTGAYVGSTHLMMLVTDYGFLDLFDYIPGFPEARVEELWDQSILSNGIQYVSLDWLKQMKRSAGRPQDVLDLENLE
jgi:hypothetical protein